MLDHNFSWNFQKIETSDNLKWIEIEKSIYVIYTNRKIDLRKIKS